MKNRFFIVAALVASTLLLNSCGFVTAPLGYGSAYVGKGTVKTADKGVEYGKKTANIVVDTAITVAEAAAQGMKTVPEAPAPRGSLRPR